MWSDCVIITSQSLECMFVIPSCSSLRECRFPSVLVALHGTTSFLHHSMLNSSSMPILESLSVSRAYKATARFLHTKCLSVRLGERLQRLCLLCFTLVASHSSSC